MLTVDGKYLCALCGVQIDIAPDDRPRAVIKASSGESNVRVVMLGDVELHACPVFPAS